VFITTSTFTPRATTIGIKTIDGDQLETMERRAKWRRFVRFFSFSLILSAVAIRPLSSGSAAHSSAGDSVVGGADPDDAPEGGIVEGSSEAANGRSGCDGDEISSASSPELVLT
jgi:hypothetical protein